ncbi:MAG: DUF421 domain-containing protein [Gammaproteobacteria bacterium]
MTAEIQWDELFGLSIPALELIIRGTAVYWFLFLLFRFVLRREIGSIGLTDVLFVVVVADAAQNGMAGEYKSITDGFILIATIAAWNVLVDWLNMKFPSVRNVLEARPLMLVSNGRILSHNLRKELLTEEELLAKLREEGIENIQAVKFACMESDGKVSVIKRR